MKISQREIWVDDVKVIACMLVALGHFFVRVAYTDRVDEIRDE